MDEVKPNSEPETLDAPSTFGGRRPSSCSHLFWVRDEIVKMLKRATAQKYEAQGKLDLAVSMAKEEAYGLTLMCVEAAIIRASSKYQIIDENKLLSKSPEI